MASRIAKLTQKSEDKQKPPKSPSTGKRALPPPSPIETETDEPAKPARPPIPPLPKENAEDKKVSSSRGKSKLPMPPSFTDQEIPAIPPRFPVQREKKVTQRVLDYEQKFGKQKLKVESAFDPVPNARYSTIRPSSFVISGMSPSTSHESLKEFLETKTKYKVQDLFDVSKANVSVSFTPDSKPDLTELQMVLQSDKLDGKHLHIEFKPEDDDDDDQSDYMEPLIEKCVSLIGETFKYMELFKKETVQKQLNKVHVTATFDSEKFEVKLKGQKNDLQKAEKCLKNIADNLVVVEKKIEKPGIETFLDSDEAKREIFEIEKAEQCAIFVSGSIYETFYTHQDDDNVFTDSDSNPSGGSFQSADCSETGSKTTNTDPTSEVVGPAIGDYVLLHFNEDMAKFKIGVCQFQLKKGKVEDEDVTCAVNVTQTDIEQGDLWSVLKESDQKELQRQLNMKTLLLEWSKKGIVMSTTSGLPYQFMIHVSVKNSGGELRKAIRKTFQMAQTYPEITSMVFYRRTDPVADDDPCPRFLLNYVDEINKYQKTGHPGVKDIRLILDRMDDSYVTGVRQEFENLLALSKKQVLKNNLLNMIPKRLRSYSSPLPVKEPSSETFQVYIKTEHKHQDTAKPVEVVHLNPGEDQSLVGAETEIHFCSENKQCINRALSRFMEYSEANMPPKIVDNPKIHFLSESQIQLFRKRAGRRVEVDVKTNNGRIEIRGYSKDVDSVYARLKIELDRIQEPIQVGKESTPEKRGSGNTVPENTGQVNTNQTAKETKEAAGSPEDNRQEDDYDVFGKHVACELRGIKDSAKRSKVKRDIQRVLFDAAE